MKIVFCCYMRPFLFLLNPGSRWDHTRVKISCSLNHAYVAYFQREVQIFKPIYYYWVNSGSHPGLFRRLQIAMSHDSFLLLAPKAWTRHGMWFLPAFGLHCMEILISTWSASINNSNTFISGILSFCLQISAAFLFFCFLPCQLCLF